MKGFDLNAEYNPKEEEEKVKDHEQEQQEDAKSSVSSLPAALPSTRINNLESPSVKNKRPEVTFALQSIAIGTWQYRAKWKQHTRLEAMIWYRRKVLAWQIKDIGELMRIEIPWGHISTIEGTDEMDEAFGLQIQLSMPPIFYHQTWGVWSIISDFTEGQQATHIRIHCALSDFFRVRREDVRGYYEKMLKCDARLRQLSKMPFPWSESPHFYSIPPPSVSSNVDSSTLTTPNPILSGDKSQTPTLQGLKVAGSSDNVDPSLSLSLGGNVDLNVNEGED